MLTPRSAACRRGQWSLIGSLVALAIILILAAVYLPRVIRPAGTSSHDATVMQRANGTACVVYQSEINTAVQSYKIDHDGQPPQTLDDLKNNKYGVTDEMLHSPGCAFQMGPGGVVTDVGHGQAPPPTAPPMPGQPASPPPPANGTRGPGGVTIPNIPGAGSAPAGGGDTGD